MLPIARRDFFNAPRTAAINSLGFFNDSLGGSWVVPNASCPVCGTAVYFYKSADGGRVYFDELGPPWPKHACTDWSSDLSSAHELNALQGRWDQDGWEALVDFQVSQVGADKLYKVSGRGAKYDRTLLFRLGGSFNLEIVRFRERAGVTVEFSALARDGYSADWLVCEGLAKIAPNNPPTSELVVSQHIHYVDIEHLDSKKATGDASSQLFSSSAGTSDTPLDQHVAVDVLVRVEQIDKRVEELVQELLRLNLEKTQLLRESLP